jgi:hypothetical protein
MRMPEAVALMRAGGELNIAVLHTLEFADGTEYVWQGVGPLVAGGITYQGIGDVVNVDGTGQQAGVVAGNLTITLAGASDLLTDPLLIRVMEQQTLVKGRRYVMGLQFCDEGWQPVDTARIVYVGVMDQMTVKWTPDLRQVILNVESPFVRRRVPRLETFSDRDQKSKFPTDKGLENVSGLKDKIVKWPKY